MPGGFKLDERVECRDHGEDWKVGTVVSVEPLKVKPDGWDQSFAWQEVRVRNGIPSGIHPGVSCDRSGMMPIVGIRYHLRGHNYDLCQEEYDKLNATEKSQYEAIPASHGQGHLEAEAYNAASGGENDELERLIALGADIEWKNPDEEGATLLVAAAANGHLGCVETLLSANAQVDVQAEMGVTALMLSAANGHLECCAALIGADAQVDAKAENGGTALMAAAAEGHSDVVALLLGSGADPGVTDEDGDTALDLARQGDHSVAVTLLENGRLGRMAYNAASGGENDELERLIALGADIEWKNPDEEGATPIMVAAAKGHSDCVVTLLSANAQVDAKAEKNGVTALMAAAAEGHLDCVSALLIADAQVDVKGMEELDGVTALHLAATEGHSDVVALLLKSGADPGVTDKDGDTALDLARQKGHDTIVGVLTAWGPMTYDAASGGENDELERLIALGADIEWKNPDEEGATPIMVAAANGHSDCVVTLIGADAQVDASQNEGATALMAAAVQGHSKCVAALLGASVQVDVMAEKGYTALHLAAVNGHSDVVAMLLKSGADRALKDEDGDTALDMARREGHSVVVALLEAPPRPRVGQRVLVIGGAHRMGESGTLIEDDGSSMPFKVKFSLGHVDAESHWFTEEDITPSVDLQASVLNLLNRWGLHDAAAALALPAPQLTLSGGWNAEDLFAVPPTITEIMAQEVKSRVRAQKPLGIEFRDFYPHLVISYASGCRPQDSEGTGPGMYYAAGMIGLLHERGLPCFSGLHVPPGTDWEVFMLRLKGRRAEAKLLIVLETAALYESEPCLKEINAAIKKGIPLLPIRFEDVTLSKRDQWPKLLDEDSEIMISHVQDKLGKINGIPHPGTVLTVPNAIVEIMDTITHHLHGADSHEA